VEGAFEAETVGDGPTDPIGASDLIDAGGDTIERYKLLQQIGEGGFGTVYLAEQTEPVKRHVALKVIKAGMDSKQVIARFEAERQALALMDHPNIAAVHDAGTTDKGRPYFVMELVKGIPITTYCAEQEVDTVTRLALFTDVCAAVQHAHQKGVIHRDLKPTNILVSPHDGKPVVKVIDFGIAKAVSMELTDKTMFTRLGQMMGTPQYMSPEQAELNALDVDTRSDIYSLGVLLYELLTGTTPLDGKELRSAAYDEMQRLIREETPAKPSTRISTLRQQRSKSSTVRVPSSSLPADLDWITMKALEKDRTRRYETASALAQDISRHLREEPVQAGPPTASYRLGKFVRRNRRALLSSALAAAALLVGLAIAGGIWLNATVEKNERVAHAVDLIGQAEDHLQQNADALADFDDDTHFLNARIIAQRAEESLTGIDDLDTEVRARRQELQDVVSSEERVRELVHAIEEAMIEEISGIKGKAEVQSIPDAFAVYGFDPLALPVEEAEEIILAQRTRVRERILVGLQAWSNSLEETGPGDAARLSEIIERCDPDPWRRSLRKAIKEQESAALEALVDSDEMAEQTEMIALHLSSVLQEEQLADATELLLRRAQGNAPESFWTNYMLGAALAGAIDRREGSDLREAYVMGGSIMSGTGLPGVDPERNPSRPEFDEAIGFMRAAVAARPGAETAWIFLGMALIGGGYDQQALATVRRAASSFPDSRGLDGMEAMILLIQDSYEEALPSVRRVAEREPESKIALYMLGSTLAELGKYDEAREVLQKFAGLDDDESLRFVSEIDTSQEALPHVVLGGSQLGRLDFDEVMATCRAGLEADPNSCALHCLRAIALLERGEIAAAEKSLERAVELAPDVGAIHNFIGTSLMQRGRIDQAIPYLRKAVELDPSDATAHSNLGASLSESGDYEAALVSCKKAIELKPRYAMGWNNLGTVYDRLGDADKAEEQFRKTLDLDPENLQALRNLATILRKLGEFDEAIAITQELSEPESYRQLGRALMMAGKSEQAIETLQRALALKPEWGEIHDDLGVLLADMARYGEARKSFESAVTHAPNYAQGHANLGFMLGMQGEYERGIDSTLAALELDSSKESPMNNLLANLYHAGRIEGFLLIHRESCERPQCGIEELGRTGTKVRDLIGHGDPDSPEVRSMLRAMSSAASKQSILSLLLPPPTEEDLRAVWENHREEVETHLGSATVRTIALINQFGSARPLANRIRNQLLDGADFATLAKEHSIDSASEDGGLRPSVKFGELSDTLWEASLLQPIGEVGALLEDIRACYLLKVESREPGKADKFEDPGVKEACTAVFNLHRRDAWEKRYVERLKLPANDLGLARLHNLLGRRALENRRLQRAKNHFEQALATRMEELGETDPRTVETKKNLAMCNRSLEKLADGKGRHEDDIPNINPGEAKSIEEAQQELDALLLAGDPDRPEVVFAIADLGTAYSSANRFDEAIAQFKRAEAIARRVQGQNSLTAASLLAAVSDLHGAQGEYRKAVEATQESLRIRKVSYGDNHSIVAESLNDLGLLLTKQGKFTLAQPLIEEALRIRRQVWGDKHRSIVETLTNLGLNLRYQYKLEQAVEKIEEAAAMARELGDEEETLLSTTLNNLGEAYKLQGNYTEAEKTLKQALQILDEREPTRAGRAETALSNLGLVLNALGRKDEAEAQFRKALEISEQLWGRDHPDRGVILSNLGTVISGPEAMDVFREALDLAKRQPEPDPAHVAVCLNNLGRESMSLDQVAESEKLLAEGVEIARQIIDGPNPSLAACLLSLAQTQLFRVNMEGASIDGAVRNSAEALEIARKIFRTSPLELAEFLETRSMVLLTAGEFAEAEPLLREKLNLERERLGARPQEVAQILDSLSLSLSRQKRPDEAEAASREAVEIWDGLLKEMPDPGQTTLWMIHLGRSNLAISLGMQKKFSETEKTLRECIELEERLDVGALDPTVSWLKLARVLKLQEKFEEAEEPYREALDVMIEQEHPRTFDCLVELCNILERQKKFTEAEAVYEKGIQVFGGEDPPIQHAKVLFFYARMLDAQGKYPEAEVRARLARSRFIELKGETDIESLYSSLLLASILENQDRGALAEVELRRVLEPLDDEPDPHRGLLSSSLHLMANIMRKQDRLEEAEMHIRRVLDDELSTGTEEMIFRNELAKIKRDQGEFDEADAIFERVLKGVEQEYGKDGIEVVSVLISYGKSSQMQEDFAKALPLLERALAIMEKEVDPDRAGLAKTFDVLSKIHEGLGDGAKAKEFQERKSRLKGK